LGKVDEFFREQAIVLELDDGQMLRAFMRPMKVKEIAIACRIQEMQESGVAESEYLPFFIQLVEGAINIDINSLPMAILDKLIDIFITLNFGEEKKTKEEKEISGKREIFMPSKLAVAFDFLIHQGHNYCDILEYTLPQIKLFQEVAVERLTGVKREDPVKVLAKAGVKIKHK